MIYIKSTSRMYPLKVIEEWIIGEGDNLKNILGTGFYNTIFVKDKDWVNFYYDWEEVKKFEKALGDLVGEEEFDDLCDVFMEKIDKPNVKIRELVPYLTIFNEFEEYPEYMEGHMERRLTRVRENTHNKLYELIGGLDDE